MQAVQKLINDLSNQGYNFASDDDLYKQKEIFLEVANVILINLPEILNESLGAGVQLIRLLILTKEPFDPTILIDLFENSTHNSSVKSMIAHTLSMAKTYDISNWILTQLLSNESAFERCALLRGLVLKASLKNVDELMDVLQQLFEKYILYELYQKIYSRFGRKNDVPSLETKLTDLSSNFELDQVRALRKRKLVEENALFLKDAFKIADRGLQKEIQQMIKRINQRKSIHPFPTTGLSFYF